MTREEQQLLLKDLCARFLYGIMCDRLGIARKVLSINPNKTQCIELDRGEYMPAWYSLEEVKPYLRPMSSITLEELEEYRRFGDYIRDAECKIHIVNYKQIDWLNKNMFDYRGLIPKGAALEAPYGMYCKIL